MLAAATVGTVAEFVVVSAAVADEPAAVWWKLMITDLLVSKLSAEGISETACSVRPQSSQATPADDPYSSSGRTVEDIWRYPFVRFRQIEWSH